MQFLHRGKNNDGRLKAENSFDALIQALIEADLSEFARSIVILKRIFKASSEGEASAALFMSGAAERPLNPPFITEKKRSLAPISVAPFLPPAVYQKQTDDRLRN